MTERTPEDFNPEERYTGDELTMDGAVSSEGFSVELLWWEEKRIFILHNVSQGEYITGTPNEMRYYIDLLTGAEEKASDLGLPIGYRQRGR